MTAQLYVLSAPSGAGKTSLVKAACERLDRVVVSVSHTTRPKRPADVDGVDYHFVEENTFHDMIGQGDFLNMPVSSIIFMAPPKDWWNKHWRWVQMSFLK